ncbi:MAG: hypothetical protein RBS39_14045, partial [Phycisphaerales bacterium]|nr:hypothetical protein [Phycisphaerales bacterium]
MSTRSPQHARLRALAAGPLAMPALVALCLHAFLPGFFSLPPIDRDESRFAQASRQMYESVAWQGTDHYNP